MLKKYCFGFQEAAQLVRASGLCNLFRGFRAGIHKNQVLRRWYLSVHLDHKETKKIPKWYSFDFSVTQKYCFDC